jgi:exonuclease V gamma subunit
MKPQVKGERDPWLIENLTFHVLDVISADGRYEAVIKQSGGPLIAARAIADRFDRYHVRRPAMIRLWEQGKATVSPTAHNPNAKQLNATDMWQFQLWSEVRKRIGQPSPAARKPELSAKTPKQILVVGFQSLSPGQIDALFYNKKAGEYQIWDYKTNKEIKTGNSHTDFSVQTDPNATIEADLSRRDFTINSMALPLRNFINNDLQYDFEDKS